MDRLIRSRTTPNSRRPSTIRRVALSGLLLLAAVTSGTAGATPANRHLDAETSTFEAGRGRWQAWYATEVGRSIWSSARGNASLRVDVTGSNGWGVALDNWPGFEASAGDKQISFWARSGSPGNGGVTMQVTWRDAHNSVLRTDTVTLPTLTNAWQQAASDVTAPLGTARVFARLVNSPGSSWRAGDYLYIDDIFVGDRPGVDTTAPTAPTDLSADAVYSNRVDLSWTASADDVGVDGYRIYRDGIQVGNSRTTSFSDRLTVRPAALYTYTVRAVDLADNLSGESNPLEVRTDDL